ncbi:hypothetical protein F2Q68_00003921 [Brassica cretica]|uniref:Uncharacterized protein n=1 Tax=Brassica cretica TaxID=69181 RepID=A0A8S9JIM1_BRACR|nr:hypothetical protein F2Q68_00003921 [Brassica cretica]
MLSPEDVANHFTFPAIRRNASHRTRARKGSQRRDRTCASLGRYVATEFEPKLGRYVATELELEPKLGRYVATERSSALSDRARTEVQSLRSDRALGRCVATELF